MQQQHELNGDIEHFLQSLQGEESAEHEADMPQEEPPQPNTEEEIQETIHVYFVREEVTQQKEEEQVIETIPPTKPLETHILCGVYRACGEYPFISERSHCVRSTTAYHPRYHHLYSR